MAEIAAIPGVAELWQLTHGEPSVRVALIDGPVDLAHPCFDGRSLEVLVPSWLPAERETEAYPRGDEARLEHGTWVASVLFGRHGSPVAGLAPGCTGLIVPSLRGEALDHDPIGLVRSIELAVRAGAHVVVIEHCLPSRSGGVDSLLKRAVRDATADGALIVAGSGNEQARCTCFPAALPEVLAVGAHDGDGRVFGFSNWGPEYDGHGLVALGEMTGAIPGAGTRVHKGTSCSTPVVGGVAALLLSLQAQRGATPNPPAVRRALLDTAAPCSGLDTGGEPRRCIAGRLDVPAATDRVLFELGRRPRRKRIPAGGSVRPSGLGGGDGSSAETGGPVFVLGRIGYDFGSRARRDAFARYLAGDELRFADTSDELAVALLLAANPSDVMGITWTLRVDAAAAYAIAPIGPHARAIDARLIQLLGAQQALGEERVVRVAVPGRLSGGDVQLCSGEVVPVVELQSVPGLRGLSIAGIADDAAATVLAPFGDGPAGDALRSALREYLARVYLDMGNPGRTPAQRALNFAATDILRAAQGIHAGLLAGKVLDTIDTQPSLVCRPGSECQDVRLGMFDPEDTRRARDIYRFTIDVAEATPVTLGSVPPTPEPPFASAGMTMNHNERK